MARATFDRVAQQVFRPAQFVLNPAGDHPQGRLPDG